MELSLSFLFLFILTLLLIIFFLNGKRSKRTHPPGPRPLPIIGNLHQVRGLAHRCFHRLSKKYGPVMLLRFGFFKVVVISSSEAAAEVLKTHDLICCSRPKTSGISKITRGGKDIGFAPYGEEWRELRKVAVLSLFSQKKVQTSRHIREEENELMVKKLSESASTRSPVNLSNTLYLLSTSIVIRSSFGQRLHETGFIGKDRVEEHLFRIQQIQGMSFQDILPWFGRFLDWLSGQPKKLEKAFMEVDNFEQRVIDDHLSKRGLKMEDDMDIVDSMLRILEEQGKDDYVWLTTDHVKGVISDVFLAGVDTSAITMIWAMAELMRNPRVMKKVQDEIRSCLGKKEKITEEDLKGGNYLKLVIKETLRLHPAAPLLLPRETMGHVNIQGYDIPPKTCLQINAFAIARDPKNWESPDDFIPERFLDSPIDYKGQHFEFLPFGSGRRICPGITMAMATVEMGLMNLLYFFDWRLPDGVMAETYMDMEETGNVTIAKKVPLELVPASPLV